MSTLAPPPPLSSASVPSSLPSSSSTPSPAPSAAAPDSPASASTARPVLELLPPSPTHLSFSASSSDVEESDVDAPRPSPISELVRICAGGGAVGRAESVRSVRVEVETDDGRIVRPASARNVFGAPRGSGLAGLGQGLAKAAPGRLMRLALPWKRKDVTEPIRVTHSPTPSAREGTFAREVSVKGWQIVGGRNFDEAKGRVGAYVVYDIELQLRNGSTVNILRRYTEFVRLRNELRAAYPHLGRTIPGLPGKNHMRKFSPEFLEDRRPRLQRFLNTVALHPEMGAGGADSVFGQWVLGYKHESPVDREE